MYGEMLRIFEINGIIKDRFEVMKCMVKKLVYVAVIASLLAACEAKEPAQQPTIDADIVKTAATDFSYVANLPSEKKEHYQTFLNDGDIAVLQTFSPEEMVLIMLDLVHETRIDALYAITYQNSATPTKEKFEQQYMDLRAYDLLETYLMFRYYDQVAINETSTPDRQVVQLEISASNHNFAKTFALQRQDGIWKILLF